MCPFFCSYHILTSSVIYYWADARQIGICLLSSLSSLTMGRSLTQTFHGQAVKDPTFLTRYEVNLKHLETSCRLILNNPFDGWLENFPFLRCTTKFEAIWRLAVNHGATRPLNHVSSARVLPRHQLDQPLSTSQKHLLTEKVSSSKKTGASRRVGVRLCIAHTFEFSTSLGRKESWLKFTVETVLSTCRWLAVEFTSPLLSSVNIHH